MMCVENKQYLMAWKIHKNTVHPSPLKHTSKSLNRRWVRKRDSSKSYKKVTAVTMSLAIKIDASYCFLFSLVWSWRSVWQTRVKTKSKLVHWQWERNKSPILAGVCVFQKHICSRVGHLWCEADTLWIKTLSAIRCIKDTYAVTTDVIWCYAVWSFIDQWFIQKKAKMRRKAQKTIKLNHYSAMKVLWNDWYEKFLLLMCSYLFVVVHSIFQYNRCSTSS